MKRIKSATHKIKLEMDVATLLAQRPQAVPVFLAHGMACVGCSMAKFETVEDAALIYGLNPDRLVNEIEQHAHPDPSTPTQFMQGDTMTQPSTYFADLLKTVETIPTESIVSRTIHQDDDFKAIVFGFDTGQVLSEHTASVPAIIHILEGECDITLGEEKYEASTGAWMRMEARLPHSILAKTPLRMLLIMLQAPQ